MQSLSPLSLDRHKVKIVDISKNGLGIVAANAVVPGTIMQVRINTAVELGEVRYCSACDGNEHRIGLRFIAVSDEKAELFSGGIGDLQIPLGQQTDRRRGPRQPINQSVVASVLRTGRVLHGEIRDLSEGGAQILLPEPLDLASSIKIEFADKSILGEVVYCRQEQPGWVLGIRLERALSGVSEALAERRGSQL